MADLKISQLNEITEISGNEMLPAAVSGGNGRISMSRMKEYVSSESGSYKVNLGKLMEDSPSAAEVSDAIGGWDNLVAAINAKMVIIGYKEGVFTNAVHAEIMESTKIIIAEHSENVAMKFSIVNSGGTLSLTRTNTELALKTDLPVVTKVPELAAAYTIPANDTTQEKIYQIAIGATVYEVTGAEGIIWQNGVAPVAEANSTLVVSVINNLAVWGTFKKEA